MSENARKFYSKMANINKGRFFAPLNQFSMAFAP